MSTQFDRNDCMMLICLAKVIVGWTPKHIEWMGADFADFVCRMSTTFVMMPENDIDKHVSMVSVQTVMVFNVQ